MGNGFETDQKKRETENLDWLSWLFWQLHTVYILELKFLPCSVDWFQCFFFSHPSTNSFRWDLVISLSMNDDEHEREAWRKKNWINKESLGSSSSSSSCTMIQDQDWSMITYICNMTIKKWMEIYLDEHGQTSNKNRKNNALIW